MPDIFEPVSDQLPYDPAPLSELIRTRSYARRKSDNSLENWDDTTDRCLYSEYSGLKFLGKFTEEEVKLVDQMQRQRKAFGSARWLWVGGTQWISKPESYPGAFNCSAWEIVDWDSFGIMMNLAMTGCGTGANVETRCIQKLPEINTKLDVVIEGKPGDRLSSRQEHTLVWSNSPGQVWILVGDSRQGWVKAYQTLLELSSGSKSELQVHVDLAGVRPAGELLKGFGGISNPIALAKMFERVAEVTNGAVGRKLNSLEVCQLIGEAAGAVVAGNIRRCIAQGETVTTSSGLVPIQFVKVGDEVLTSKGELQKVTAVFNQGWQKVYLVKTQSSFIKVTANHKLAFYNEKTDGYVWKELHRVEPGDALILHDESLPKLWDAEEILTIEDAGNDFTFDIEVEKDHEFFCNGILSHNSAGMRIGSSDDEVFTTSKDNLWQQDGKNWKIDPQRDSLRSANHTRAFHKKPTIDQCIEAVTKQFYSGEGAIQWSGEAVARANADLLNNPLKKKAFLKLYDGAGVESAKDYLRSLGQMDERELENRIRRYSTNPCARGDMRLLTTEGFKRFDELSGTEPDIVNVNGEVVKSKVWCSGHKEVVELKLANKRSIFCTPDHVWQTNEGELQASETKGKRLVPFLQKPEYGHEFIVYGFVQGDGSTGKINTGTSGVTVSIGAKDQDILTLLDACNYEYKHFSNRPLISLLGVKDTLVELGFSDNPLPYRTLPSTYKKWSLPEKAAFLNGLFSANGSVIAGCGRVTLKTTCKELANSVLESLEKDFGIEGYITTNLTKPVQFSNGVYQCKESYDVNIYRYDSKLTFFNSINFSINYKTEKLALSLIETSPKIGSVTPAGSFDVYDFTEPVTHWGVVEGFIAHNCHEIIGSDFLCNLSEVHLNNIDPFDLQEQYNAFRASSLQASALLQRGFHTERLEYARSIDPIVGVSATGFFVFFTRLFGSDYVRWWESGRDPKWDGTSMRSLADMDRVEKLIYETDETIYPAGLFIGQVYKEIEAWFCQLWKNIVFNTVWEYCDRHNLRKPNRCTTVKPSGCFLSNYLRTTDQGVMFVNELDPTIFERSEGFHPALEGFTVNQNKVTNCYNNGLSKVLRVKLSNGRILECTPSHPLSIGGKWVAAADLQTGDRLDFSIGSYRSTYESRLVPVDIPDIKQCYGLTSITRYEYPTRMSPDLSYLIGAYYANGCFCEGNSERAVRIRYSCEHLEIVENIQRLWKEILGVTAEFHKHNDRNAYYFEFASVEIGAWLKVNGLTKETKSNGLTSIPEIIRKSSAESILAFIAGYADSDGCFHSDTFCIDSVSEEMVRHLQQVGEAVGLSFGYCLNSKRQGSYGTNFMHKIHSSKCYSTPEAIETINKYSVKAKSRPAMHSIKTNGKFPYSVVSVEEIDGLLPTYDIEVDATHWYYQGGIKSHNSQTLLTGVDCNGLHPPFAPYFIRRMTFSKNDPVALAALDYGYNVVPSQNDKDENGNLLNDPFDKRCSEWLVEVPVKNQITQDFPQIADIDFRKFSALAQFDFYMNVQQNYITHTGSVTISLSEDEIEPLAQRIFDAIQEDEGYIGAALLARYDAPYPRLPFEVMSEGQYNTLIKDVLARRKSNDFTDLINKHLLGVEIGPQDSACDGGFCELKDLGKK